MSGAPKKLRLQDEGRRLRVEFADAAYDFTAEYLRVYSPSAEVQGHGQAEPNVVGGKRQVSITKIEPVGRYAVRLVFSDGHGSGLYSWDGFRHLGENHERLWERYLERLQDMDMSRDEDVVPLSAISAKNALKD